MMNRGSAVTFFAVGVASGAAIALAIKAKKSGSTKNSASNCTCCRGQISTAENQRQRLPSLIILVRHGESEGNADHTLWRTKPDNLVELTETGANQADCVGRRIEQIFQEYDKDTSKKSIKRVHLVVSPFERTLQTALCMRPWFDHRIVRTSIESRIREQEFGNLQGDQFQEFRKEQKMVGRFWYRFPTGESGADVEDRVKSWWSESVLNVNERYGYDHVDALVVVTHGLTMRFVLMQLYSWSPTTFHSVWNADNCDAYVLRKDLSKPGFSPYILDNKLGDMPRSTIDLTVEFKYGRKEVYKLEDYLSIPPPRTTRLELVKRKLAQQHPSINAEEIVSIVFMPFTEQNESTLKSWDRAECTNKSGEHSSLDKKLKRRSEFKDLKRSEQEVSSRFPNFPQILDPKEATIQST